MTTSYLDGNISLNVYLDGSSVGKKSFGLPLLLTRYRDTVDDIQVADIGTNKFTVDGDRTAEAVVGRTFFVEKSTGNDASYVVVGAVYTGGSTDSTAIEVAAIASAVADGRLVFTMDYDVTSIVTGTKTITLAGYQGEASDLSAGDEILVVGGTGGDNVYTVDSVTKPVLDLIIVTVETPVAITASESCLLAYDGLRTQQYSDGVSIAADNDKMGRYTAIHLAAGLSQKPHAKTVMLGFWGLGEAAAYTALTAVALENDDWFGMAMDSRLAAQIAATAPDATSAPAYLAGKEKIGVFQSDYDDLIDNVYDDTAAAPNDDVASVMKNLSRFNVVMNEHGNDEEFLDWALLCNRLGVDPDVSATIWTFVTLEGITANASITSTQGANMDGKNCNYYNTFGGVGSTGKGMTPKGDKIDLVITAMWLKARLTEAFAQVLLNATNNGTKIPYTDVGFQSFRGEAEKVLQQGVKANHFVGGTTGIVIPALADVPSVDRTARLLRITCGAQPAGAVESIAGNAYISINFEIQV